VKFSYLVPEKNIDSRRIFYGGISCHFGLKKWPKLRKYADETSNFAQIHKRYSKTVEDNPFCTVR
jgi:hypothetical protein